MIAYFILVHRYPAQFKRLFTAVYSPQDHYLIHVDKKAPKQVFRAVEKYLQRFPNAQMLTSQDVLWGGYSMVDVELNAIKELLHSDIQWDFFINLSGQDFPLRSPRTIHTFLKKNVGKNFLKVLNQRTERPNTLNRIQNYFLETQNGFVDKPIPRAYLAETTPYIGGQWKILTRQCCEFIDTHPVVEKFRDFYAHTLIADESFFQTVLMNTRFTQEIINDDKRAIIWIPDLQQHQINTQFTANTTKKLVESGQIKLRPKTFTMEDTTFLLNSTALFARKFDETIDAHIFDVLESRLHAHSPTPRAHTAVTHRILDPAPAFQLAV